MSGTVSVPTLFAAANSGTTPQLDANFAALVAALNNPLTYSIYAVDSGAANAYVITLAPAPANQAALLGVAIAFKAGAANTGGSTLNANGLGVQSIVNRDGSTLGAGQLPANSVSVVVWDGTNYQLQTTPSSSITLTAEVGSGGTSIQFTGIPAGTKRVTMLIDGISTNGSSLKRVQIGDSGGGFASAGYVATCVKVSGVSTVALTTSSAGFDMNSNGAADTISGRLVFDLQDAANNVWTCSGLLSDVLTPFSLAVGGDKTLPGALDRIRILAVNGTDAFDAGAVSISYER